MPNSKQIIYLSQAQYAELIANGSITVNGVTVEYNENDLYVTPQAEPVTDVRVNGASVSSNGIANIPIANSNNLGVVKSLASGGQDAGVVINANGQLIIQGPTDNNIKNAVGLRPIIPTIQHKAIFYGLAKASGDTTQSQSSNSVGEYTDEAKGSIQRMLGITDLLSTEETTTATAAHALNSLFLMGGKLYKATAAIAIGDAVVEGENCQVVKVEDVFVKNTDYATSSAVGVVKIGAGLETTANGALYTYRARSNQIKAGIAENDIISPYNQHEATFYGLAKAAGSDEKDSSLSVGQYTDNAKAAIRSMLGAAAAADIPSVPVQDVQVNGTSILNNGIANFGIGGRLAFENGSLLARLGTLSQIKTGTTNDTVLSPSMTHWTAFYGLAKAAGDTTQAASSNAVGTYTESAKTSIRAMLGAASTNIVAVQDEQPTDTDTKVWLPGTQVAGVQVPTMEDMENYVQKTDLASSSSAGIVKIVSSYGVYAGSNGEVIINKAGSGIIKSGSNNYTPIVPTNQHEAVFYGLAKAAGDSTQSASDNAVGTYTANASAAIRSMLGAVGDIQINGTSLVIDSVANIPIAGASKLGVVAISSDYGIKINQNSGIIQICGATPAIIKSPSGEAQTNYRPITAGHADSAAFYGLAKAAGDTTQSASSNAVGTYTDSAKASIKSMLGIVDGSTGTVDITGTTPSITAVENTRYVCGEVLTLSFTPAASGICIVRFTSGSTATVLTVSNTVKFPEWFDATALEADTIYEMCITDGMYGAVMSWPL